MEVDLGALGVKGAETGKKTKVWRRQKTTGPGKTRFSHFLVVNGTSIDAEQDGFDMREWVDKGWTRYMDNLNHTGPGMPPVGDKPFVGGAY